MSKILNSQRLVSSANSHKYTIFNNSLILIRYLSISEVSGIWRDVWVQRMLTFSFRMKFNDDYENFNGHSMVWNCHMIADTFQLINEKFFQYCKKSTSLQTSLLEIDGLSFFMNTRIRFEVCTWNVFLFNNGKIPLFESRAIINVGK